MFRFGTREKIAVIFDVGSSSVGAAYVSLVQGKKPSIVASAREQIAFQEDLSFERMVASMQDALARCGGKLGEYRLPHFRERAFLCSFSSPWYASQTRIATVKAEKSLMVSERTLADAVEKEVTEFLSSEGAQFEDAILMESEAIQVKLNGYDTDHPIGKDAKTMDIAVYASVLPEGIHARVKDTIGRMFHPPFLRLHSFPFEAFVAIRDIFHRASFLFADISGEVTEISVVRSGVLEETTSFPFGRNHILRSIASEIARDATGMLRERAALSALAMHARGDSHDREGKRIEIILRSSGDKWLSGFRSSMEALLGARPALPSDIFFMADSDLLEFFGACIHGERNPSVSGGIPFEARPLGNKFWDGFVDYKGSTERDAFLSLLAYIAGRGE